MTPQSVLESALTILDLGREPDADDPFVDALEGVLEATLEIKKRERFDGVAVEYRCRCDQCTSAITLAQMIIDEFGKAN